MRRRIPSSSSSSLQPSLHEAPSSVLRLPLRRGQGVLLIVTILLGTTTRSSFSSAHRHGGGGGSRGFMFPSSSLSRMGWFPRQSTTTARSTRSTSTSEEDPTTIPAVQSPFLLDVVAATLRGGYQDEDDDNRGNVDQDEDVLSEKVRRAMIKLGLTPPDDDTTPSSTTSSSTSDTLHSDHPSAQAAVDDECQGGVCEMPPRQSEQPPPSLFEEASAPASTTATIVEDNHDINTEDYDDEEQAQIIAQRLSTELKVDKSLCMAAIGATAIRVSNDGQRRKFNEAKARELLQQELHRIQAVPEDASQVQQLVSEGYDMFLSRRALAFADNNVEDARAILLADQMDEQQEQDEQEQEQMKPAQQSATPMKTVTVNSNLDPTTLSTDSSSKSATKASSTTSAGGGVPTPAKKSDVVFEATTAQIQQLVLESPVPVLLDIYADWCGPCKVLGPALEEMAIKSGGAFRLVKVNTDNERAVSSTLGVTALPTVFGLRNGKILNMFQGMPRSENMMRSFLMGLLISESNFDPPLTATEKKNYAELTSKLIKVAGAASFPFSARERLQDRIVARLDDLAVEAQDYVDAEESAQVLRSLLSNVVRDPSSMKFRTINLTNKVLSNKVARFGPSVALLKSVGFVSDSSSTNGEDTVLVLGKGKSVVNVAPLMIARECIDKWIDQNRYEVAKATRHRRDEEERAKLKLRQSMDGDESEYDDDEDEEEDADPDACSLKVRFDGKNKIHELALHGDDPLSVVLEKMSISEADVVQITCVAKRLVIASSDQESMQKSLRELGLFPTSYLVVKAADVSASSQRVKESDGSSSSLSQRASAKAKKKKGSHTMQSVGIYAKDDNNKAELIDGGGGVWYEHDVTDDEEEAKADESSENKVSDEANVDEFESDEVQLDDEPPDEDEIEFDDDYDEESGDSES